MLGTILGRKDVVETLLAHRADPNVRSESGRTALLYAVMGLTGLSGDQKGLNGGLRTYPDVSTIAFCAAWIRGDEASRAHVDDKAFARTLHDDFRGIIEMLLAHGADVNARDHYGISALGYARSVRSNDEVVQMLLKSGAKE